MMDVDLAEYDQMDEAKYFINHRACGVGADLLTTLSSEKASSLESANCENDYVFLPPPNAAHKQTEAPGTSTTTTTNNAAPKQQVGLAGLEAKGCKGAGASDPAAKLITPEQLDIRSHRPTFSGAAADAATGPGAYPNLSAFNMRPEPPNSLLAGPRSKPEFRAATASSRLANPLMSINSNANNNPFFNSSPLGPQAPVAMGAEATSLVGGNRSIVTSQPFWMRSDHFASKPIGLLEAAPSGAPNSATSSSHLSELMHQIITKSDSIFIAIPCLFCQDSKTCPPSDISAWLSHMNRTHNCKLCPICNKLVGLGPMRDIEIMRKHVVAHIDEEWLERRSAKTNFSFGLQQQWFSSGRCTVRDPRTGRPSK